MNLSIFRRNKSVMENKIFTYIILYAPTVFTLFSSFITLIKNGKQLKRNVSSIEESAKIRELTKEIKTLRNLLSTRVREELAAEKRVEENIKNLTNALRGANDEEQSNENEQTGV